MVRLTYIVNYLHYVTAQAFYLPKVSIWYLYLIRNVGGAKVIGVMFEKRKRKSRSNLIFRYSNFTTHTKNSVLYKIGTYLEQDSNIRQKIILDMI